MAKFDKYEMARSSSPRSCSGPRARWRGRIALEDGLLFPDFELCRRTTGERYWLEVIGFWTPEYLAHKLDQLRRARLSRLILCVDATRQCDAGELDALGSIVRFRRKIDARDVIAIVDPALAVRLAERDRRSRGRKR